MLSEEQIKELANQLEQAIGTEPEEVLEEDSNEIFEINTESPYMLFVAKLKNHILKKINDDQKYLVGLDKLHVERSSLPAVTHVDNTARIQTVSKKKNERFYKLISSFKRKTNCPVIVNTSFNVRGEPIVRTPKDAYLCFMRTEMDILVLENQILFKEKQPNIIDNKNWLKEFELD